MSFLRLRFFVSVTEGHQNFWNGCVIFVTEKFQISYFECAFESIIFSFHMALKNELAAASQ